MSFTGCLCVPVHSFGRVESVGLCCCLREVPVSILQTKKLRMGYGNLKKYSKQKPKTTKPQGGAKMYHRGRGKGGKGNRTLHDSINGIIC